MAKAGEGPKKQRVFVALDLPEPVRAGLSAWGKAELVDPALRVTRAESLHVTLVFLGAREPAAVEEIAAVVERSAVPAPLIKLEDPIALPRRGRASLFALPAPSAAAPFAPEVKSSCTCSPASKRNTLMLCLLSSSFRK